MSEPSRDIAWQGAKKGAAVLVVGRLTAAACGLVQMPIALAHLGPERFGLWIALTGALWAFAGFDAGIGFAVQNRCAAALATGRDAEAAAVVRRGLLWLTLAGGAVALVGAPWVIAGNGPQWLGARSPELARETEAAVRIVFVAVVACLPLSLAPRVAAAAQALWIPGVWTMVASLLGLAAVAGSARLGLSLPAFTASACILPVLPPLATAGHLLLRHRWLRARRDAPPPQGRTIAHESALFFVPQLSAALVTSFVPTLVAIFSGPVAAGGYGILQRLFGIGLQFQALALQPTWPAYTHAAALHDSATARRLYRASWLLTAVVAAGIAVVMAPGWEPILHLWLGRDVPPLSPSLVWAVAAWHILQCAGQPAAILLNGFGRMKPVAVTAVLTLVLTLLLCLPLGRTAGALGVVAALAVPHAGINLPVLVWHARRALADLAAHAR